MPAPIPKINGSSQGVVNENVISFRPFSGGEYGGTYEGPDAAVAPLVQTLFNAGFSVDYKKSKSAISTLTYRASFSVRNNEIATNPNVDFQDTWELVRNTTEKELLESDHPLIYALTDKNLSELKTVIARPGLVYKTVGTGVIDFSGTFTNDGTTKPAAPMSSFNAAVYLFELFSSGVKTIPVKQPILKFTRTTNPLYDAPFNVSNVDTLLSTASMIADSGVPSTFAVPLVQLADQLALKAFPTGIPDPPIQIRSDVLVLEFAWKKELTSVNKHGNKRIQYIGQYEFGLWDTGIYGLAS